MNDIRRSLLLTIGYLRMRWTRYAHANNCPGGHGVEMSCEAKIWEAYLNE